MSVPATLPWFARHEISLSWRDFVMMMTAGKPERQRVIVSVILIALLALHALAWSMIAASLQGEPDPMGRLLMTTGTIALGFSLMGSQAMESVTRVFYSRSDLDLILSSPVSMRRIFLVRIGSVCLATSLLSLMLAAPAINVLAVLDSPRWLLAYPFVLCLGTVSTLFALTLTVFLFRTIGAKRTRMVAQIVAAVVGALFIIGIQIAAIASIGSINRIEFLNSPQLRGWAPAMDSAFWIPAQAASGSGAAFMAILAFTLAMAAAATLAFSRGFAENVIAASGLSETRKRQKRGKPDRMYRSVAATLRHKEWTLLARDHWLVSQTLMQIFYLLPPAFMLWKGFGSAGAVPTVVMPVMVMAAGQLAGGLAWLAISGEDAPQLVATAPLQPHAIIRAKIEAVLGAVGAVVLPIIAFVTWVDPALALICTGGIVAASVSATAIQLWFRSQAKRSNFRRRHTSSRIATLAEAFSSISWAGCIALWANGSWTALIPATIAILVLVGARALRPNPAGEYLH